MIGEYMYLMNLHTPTAICFVKAGADDAVLSKTNALHAYIVHRVHQYTRLFVPFFTISKIKKQIKTWLLDVLDDYSLTYMSVRLIFAMRIYIRSMNLMKLRFLKYIENLNGGRYEKSDFDCGRNWTSEPVGEMCFQAQRALGAGAERMVSGAEEVRVMRFMQQIKTVKGTGHIVGRGEDGTVMVVHRREEMKEPPGAGPCFHRFYQWCEKCQVAYEVRCPVCGNVKNDKANEESEV